MERKTEVSMLPKKKNTKYKLSGLNIEFTISKNVPDYGNHPFFIKKAQESKEWLEKHGFPPEELLNLRRKSKITK